jgi:hypothetical protein
MIVRTRIYDFIHKAVVLGLVGGSAFGLFAVYSEINRLKAKKAREISEAQMRDQINLNK